MQKRMLTKFKVENFKSIHSLELELGRVNVFIGENGSGKSNVLEAVALASAALIEEWKSELLVSKGVRIADPNLMRSAFESNKEPLKFKLEFGERIFETFYLHDGGDYRDWKVGFDYENDPVFVRLNTTYSRDATINEVIEIFHDYGRSVRELVGEFLIYFPENTTLRNFENEAPLQPLGIYGQGLFKLLKKFSEEPDQPAIRELNERLQLFGWFDSFALPERLWPGESFLKIRDRYLDANIDFIDQRSANEGFLFVLFYLSLFISKDTPKFFAIDNIETSLNPMMCTKLMTTVAELAKTHDKQVMITTHSPAILDGINLNDDEQRLFVVYRNAYGHTVARRVKKPQPLPGQLPAKLSTLFMAGHLGGMPTNFSL
jgi:predicted ATPase